MRKLLILSTLVIAFGLQANSQVRNIDIEVKILSPQTNDTVYIGQSFNITTQIKNLGPDTITANDSVEYRMTHNGSQVTFNGQKDHIAYAANTLMPGDSATLNFQLGLGQGNMPGSFVLCSNLKLRSDTDTIIDSDTTNNTGCATIYVQDSALSISNTITLNDVVNVYPNPTSTVAYFDVTLNKTTDLQINITDMMGRVVITSQQLGLTKGQHKIKVDTDMLPEGSYLYNVDADGDMANGRLLIQ